MRFLLENQSIVTDQVLFEHNQYNYGSIFGKINAYNSRAKYVMNESVYFNNRFAFNPDIMFTINEQEAINSMLVQMRAHLQEEMSVMINTALVTEGLWDKMKQAGGTAKEYLGKKYDEITDKFASGIKMINSLLDSGIDSVKKFINAIGELFVKLGDSIQDALKKLGAFRKDDSAEGDNAEDKVDIDNKILDGIPSEEQTFFAHVVAYINEVVSDKKKTAAIMNEGVVDAVANNKYLQFVIGHRKGKKWGWWHTILVSIVGSLIVGIVLPMVMYALGVSAATTIVVCTAVRIIWMSRGVVKVLLNRYLNKKAGEKFFDFWTSFALFMAVVPLAVLQIPAVHEWMTDALKNAFHALGIDKAVEWIEDWLAKVAEHITGKNPTTGAEYHKAGEWIKYQIESVRNSGDTHVDLMTDGNAHDYINKLFSGGGKADLSKFVGDTNELKTWMEYIADGKFTNSTEMLNNIGMMSGDAPLTAMLDGNTFAHVSREALANSISKHAAELGIHCDLVNVSEDLLREKTKGFAGTAFALIMDGNATTENAGIFKELMTKVAQDMNIHDVDTFGQIMNHLQDFGSVWQEGPLNHETVHTLFDTVTKCFAPMFLPWFDNAMWEKYMIRLGSNASGMPAYRVTDVKHLSLDKVKKIAKGAPGVDLLIRYLNDIQKQNKTEIQAAAKQEKEDNDGKVSKNGRNFFQKIIDRYNTNADADKRELMVVFISGIIKKKNAEGKMEKIVLKNEPAVVFDMNTMMCADIASWSRKRRNTPYLMRGLFSKLDFIPTERNDNDTKQFIYEMLNKTMETAVKQCVSFGNGQMYVKKSEDGKKFIPVDKKQSENRFFDLGNLTPNELCGVLNGNIEPYSLFAGKYGDSVSMRIDKKTGELKKSAAENKKVIEKKRWKKVEGKFIEDPNGKYDYIDAKIIPFINRPNSAVYKELKDDKDVAELLFDEKGKMNTGIITDKKLNLKEFLYRPMQTFSKDDKVKLAEGVNKYLKGKSKKEKIDAYNTIKTMIEIIWVNMRKTIKKNIESERAKSGKKDEK